MEVCLVGAGRVFISFIRNNEKFDKIGRREGGEGAGDSQQSHNIGGERSSTASTVASFVHWLKQIQALGRLDRIVTVQ